MNKNIFVISTDFYIFIYIFILPFIYCKKKEIKSRLQKILYIYINDV